MGVLLLVLVFLFALSRFGRIGPFVWAGPPRRFGPPPWMHHGASLPEGNVAPVTRSSRAKPNVRSAVRKTCRVSGTASSS